VKIGRPISTAIATHAALKTGVHALALGARVYNSVAQAIPTSTDTAVTFDSERYDTDTIHEGVTNPSRLTCRTAGKYLIGIALQLDNLIANKHFCVILKLNGTTEICRRTRYNVGGEPPYLGMNAVYDLAVGDYVETVVHHDNGNDRNILAVEATSPEFWMNRIG